MRTVSAFGGINNVFPTREDVDNLAVGDRAPGFKCGVSVSLLQCQHDKKGICTLDADKGVKCGNRGGKCENG